MQQPSFIPIPFAENGNKDSIPLTKQATGRASWNTGFPPETSLPQGAGGYAPMRTDFQGVLYELSAHIFFGQSGNVYAWDNGLDYNSWAHVLDTDSNNVTREYVAVAVNGPSTSNVTQPSADVNYTCWKPLVLFLTDYVYPVGSIYMTTAATNPGTIFGGTWSKIESKFLIGASANYGVGTSGGSATKTLSVTEIPSHNHTATTSSNGSHNHTATTASNGDHTHTITVNNNGAHTHTTSGTAASAGSHTHGLSITNGAQSAGAHTHSVAKSAQSISVTTGSNGAHTHGVSFPKTTIATVAAGSHTHTRGTMNITGSFQATDSQGAAVTVSGAFTARNVGNGDTGEQANELKLFSFDASRSWSGATSEQGNHTHNVTIAKTDMTTASAGAHTHSVSITVPAQTLTAASAGAHTHNLTGTSESAGAHTHSVSGTAASAGSHNHAASTASNGAHTHSITVANNGSHTHTLTTSNMGGGNAFSIIPPYYAVYIWQRTA